MLKSLIECKVPVNFLIIEDREEVSGHNLFTAFLTNSELDKVTTKRNLLCYENPPDFYIPSTKLKNEKIVSYNFFSNPCGWKNSTPKQDLSIFTSDPKSLSECAFFIDSLSLLAHYEGFFSMCRNLNILKRYSKKLVCVVHGDLLNDEQLEELSFLSSTLIKLQLSSEDNFKADFCEVSYKKPAGKIIKHKEFFNVNDDFKVTSRIKESKALALKNKKTEIENLSTFKLGFNLSERERKARNELILPFLKIKAQNKTGEIIYQPEVDEFEDDPDDDLEF